MNARTILMAGLLSIVLIPMGRAKAKRDSVRELAKSNNEFGIKVYDKLATCDGNLMFSPFSLSSALAMTYMGARQRTENEMAAVLSLSLGQQRVAPAFKALNEQLCATKGIQLNIANALCSTQYDVSDDFKTLLRLSFEAETFKGDLSRINGWVKQKSNGKIAKILDKLSPNSVCVLLNAVYFKGRWNEAFDKTQSKEATFYVQRGKAITVPMMHKASKFSVLNKKSFQAIALPYRARSMSMVVFLPREIDGLRPLEKGLTAKQIQSVCKDLDAAAQRKVNISIPRFSLESKVPMEAILQDLGMKDAFNMDRANFTGMGWPKGELRITQVKHAAVLEVNEEGSEAAASTAVEMQTRCASRPETVRINRPFLFLIRDNATGTILFMGRVIDPSK